MSRRKKPSRFVRWFLILACLAVVTFAGLAAFRAGPPPAVLLAADLPGIGKATKIHVDVAEPTRGLAGFRVEFVQGDRVEILEERSYVPLEPWEFWGDRTTQDQIDVIVGSETVKDLKEGPAQVRVVVDRAKSFLRRPAPVIDVLDLPVKLRPPQLQIVSTRTYVAQGGSETVVYRVGADSVRDGIQAGEWWFPGFPLPGGDEQDRFAFFGVPYMMDSVDGIRLIAVDEVGNRSSAAFIDRFFERPLKKGTIRVDDRFMERVVPAILSQTPELEDQGSLLENYLMVNGKLRVVNNQILIDLNENSIPDFLWSKKFLQMRNAQVMSDFAARRSYIYNGDVVDTQDHLGFDLASTAMAEIESANAGVVVLARYLGIYGNTVVVDHGYGLMSLYGHLSSISVEEGQEVQRGEAVGRSGATGLAGGDHLHFGMMLQGMPVNPREWWDDHWIEDRLKLKLGDAMPFGG